MAEQRRETSEIGHGWTGQTPVAMLVFNRPEPTRRVFEQVQRAKPRRLLVVADGPRADRPGEEQRCRETRAVIDEGVDWDCEVVRNYAAANLGCKRRVSSGIDWVFEQVEEAIILEDDCVPDPTFFPYCAQMLEHFRHEPRAMAISGDNFLSGQNKGSPYDYFFSRFVHIWGWATWRRAWKLYDVNMKAWPEFRDGGWLLRMFGDESVAQGWESLLSMTFDGTIDTWDYQLLFATWIHGTMGVIPNRNLVTNIGFNSQATHTLGYTTYSEKSLERMTFPIRHAPFLIRDVRADETTQRIFYGRPSLPERVRRKALRLARALQGKE